MLKYSDVRWCCGGLLVFGILLAIKRVYQNTTNMNMTRLISRLHLLLLIFISCYGCSAQSVTTENQELIGIPRFHLLNDSIDVQLSSIMVDVKIMGNTSKSLKNFLYF